MSSISALAHEARLIAKYFGSYPAKEAVNMATQKLRAASDAELWRQMDGKLPDNAYPEPGFSFKKQDVSFASYQASSIAADRQKI